MDIRTLEQIFKESRTVAVVGLSPRPHRDSYRVAAYLQAQGYRIIPVNPKAWEILGERAYPTLTAIPEPVDIVDIFRRPEHVPAIVEEAVQMGARAVWMQVGIVHQAAAERARSQGLDVVMDRCTKTEHQGLARKGVMGRRG
jgi:predicted CoA-binding protein